MCLASYLIACNFSIPGAPLYKGKYLLSTILKNVAIGSKDVHFAVVTTSTKAKIRTAIHCFHNEY